MFQDQLEKQRKELTRKLDESRLSQEYMKGQLNSIGLVMGKMSSDLSNPAGMKALAAAISQMALSNAAATEITTDSLCHRTKDLVEKLRLFQDSFDKNKQSLEDGQRTAFSAATTAEEKNRIWDRYTAETTQLYQTATTQFRTTLVPEAIYLRDEMLKKIPAEQQPKVSDLTSNAFGGDMAGPYPGVEMASYLELLSKRVCQR